MEKVDNVKTLFSSFLYQKDSSETTVSSPDQRDENNGKGQCRTGEKPLAMDREAFYLRVKSYSHQSWFAKPLWLSPLVCSSYGWTHVDTDVLQCITCRACISTRMTKNYTPNIRDDVCRRIEDSLGTGHNKCCPWPSNPTPASVYAVPSLVHSEAVSGFENRLKGLLECKTFLPRLDTESLPQGITPSDLNCWFSAYQTQLVDTGGGGSTDDETRAVWNSACLLALSGWQSNSEDKKKLTCDCCQRSLGLWNYISHQPQQRSADSSLPDSSTSPHLLLQDNGSEEMLCTNSESNTRTSRNPSAYERLSPIGTIESSDAPVIIQEQVSKYYNPSFLSSNLPPCSSDTVLSQVITSTDDDGVMSESASDTAHLLEEIMAVDAVIKIQRLEGEEMDCVDGDVGVGGIEFEDYSSIALGKDVCVDGDMEVDDCVAPSDVMPTELGHSLAGLTETPQDNTELSQDVTDILQTDNEIHQAITDTTLTVFEPIQTDNETSQTGNETSQTGNETSQAYSETSQADNGTSQTVIETCQADGDTSQADIEIRHDGIETSQVDNETSQEVNQAYNTGNETIQSNIKTSTDGNQTSQTDTKTSQPVVETNLTGNETSQTVIETILADSETIKADNETSQTVFETITADSESIKADNETSQTVIETSQVDIEIGQLETRPSLAESDMPVTNFVDVLAGNNSGTPELTTGGNVISLATDIIPEDSKSSRSETISEEKANVERECVVEFLGKGEVKMDAEAGDSSMEVNHGGKMDAEAGDGSMEVNRGGKIDAEAGDSSMEVNRGACLPETEAADIDMGVVMAELEAVDNLRKLLAETMHQRTEEEVNEVMDGLLTEVEERVRGRPLRGFEAYIASTMRVSDGSEPSPKRRKKEACQRQFDMLGEHQMWCPWVTVCYPKYQAGWRIMMKMIQLHYGSAAKSPGVVMKNASAVESLRNVRSLIKDWT